VRTTDGALKGAVTAESVTRCRLYEEGPTKIRSGRRGTGTGLINPVTTSYPGETDLGSEQSEHAVQCKLA